MTSHKSFESKESIERGRDVEIDLKFLRHGEREIDGRLTDLGRRITRERVRESRISEEDYDAIKAIGSDAGKASGVGMRALETAEIFADELAGEEAFNTRVNKLLSYEGIVSKIPYDHSAIYNEHLPHNFENLPDEERIEAARIAQKAAVDHLMALDTPEAENYKKETAGAFAEVVLHYKKVAERLKSGSRVLMPAGTHGGSMEFLPYFALVRKDADGNEITGFKDTTEIGGAFNPSEAYTIKIETNEEGKFKPLEVIFDNREVSSEPMYLDEEKLKELAEFYEGLHPKDGMEV